MHLLALTACLLSLVVKMSEAAVAVGVGRLNPGENSFPFLHAAHVRHMKQKSKHMTSFCTNLTNLLDEILEVCASVLMQICSSNHHFAARASPGWHVIFPVLLHTSKVHRNLGSRLKSREPTFRQKPLPGKSAALCRHMSQNFLTEEKSAKKPGTPHLLLHLSAKFSPYAHTALQPNYKSFMSVFHLFTDKPVF